MEDGRSRFGVSARQVGRVIGLGAAFAWGCATGVDVTDEELATICAEPGTTCTGTGSGGTNGAVGSAGTSSGVSGSSNGGTFTGSGGSSGSSNNTGGSSGSSNNTGGSSGSSNNTGGSSGTGATTPLAEGDCLDQSDVTILYRDRKNGEASTNEPSMVLSVQNSGTDFPLSALTIRYWFTADGGSNFTGNVDYATLDGQGDLKGSTTVTFGMESGSNYAELGFMNATGTVNSTGVREVQLRFHSDPYANMTQTNDFSFLSPATAATPNPNITPYVSGEQVGGCVPRP
jgi:cellulose binding protein with CBM3 domain